MLVSADRGIRRCSGTLPVEREIGKLIALRMCRLYLPEKMGDETAAGFWEHGSAVQH
jgi:hypothetical protein